MEGHTTPPGTVAGTVATGRAVVQPAAICEVCNSALECTRAATCNAVQLIVVQGIDMPDDALIGELDRLREIYSQRQKATNNLLATLKGTTAALSKTNRILREYADLNPDTND